MISAGRLSFTRRLWDRRIGTYVPNGRSHHGLGQRACADDSFSTVAADFTLEFQTYPDRVPSHRSNIPHGDLSKCSDVIRRPTSPLILNNSHWILSRATWTGSYGTNSRRRDVQTARKDPIVLWANDLCVIRYWMIENNIQFFSYTIYDLPKIFYCVTSREKFLSLTCPKANSS